MSCQFVSADIFSLQINLMPACVLEHFFPILFDEKGWYSLHTLTKHS